MYLFAQNNFKLPILAFINPPKLCTYLFQWNFFKDYHKVFSCFFSIYTADSFLRSPFKSLNTVDVYIFWSWDHRTMNSLKRSSSSYSLLSYNKSNFEAVQNLTMKFNMTHRPIQTLMFFSHNNEASHPKKLVKNGLKRLKTHFEEKTFSQGWHHTFFRRIHENFRVYVNFRRREMISLRKFKS